MDLLHFVNGMGRFPLRLERVHRFDSEELSLALERKFRLRGLAISMKLLPFSPARARAIQMGVCTVEPDEKRSAPCTILNENGGMENST